MRKRIAFWIVQSALAVALIVAGTEFIASYYAPPSPYLLLRPYMVEGGFGTTTSTEDKSSNAEPFYNSWGMRDHERSSDRPANVTFRSVFVGDSFLEGHSVKAPLSVFVENIWTATGHTGMEAINLGVSATDPPQYYYRIERVALPLKPDVVLMMFYSGNDFVAEPFQSHTIPPFISELPEPSILGAVAPNLTWLITDRLRLSENGSSNKRIPNEFQTLNALVDKPRAERLAGFARHLKQYYYPELGEETIREVLSRADEDFWLLFKSDSKDRHYLQGWMLKNIIGWETSTYPLSMNAAEADRMVDVAKVEATLTWLVAARRLVEAQGVKFVVALAPVGIVDSDYVKFWRAWPRAFSYWLGADARHRKLVNLLHQQNFNVIDLETCLDGVPGTYRLSDSHWSEHGHEIVAQRLAREFSGAKRTLPALHR